MKYCLNPRTSEYCCIVIMLSIVLGVALTVCFMEAFATGILFWYPFTLFCFGLWVVYTRAFALRQRKYQLSDICLEYSEQTLHSIRKVYQGEIVDYRHLVSDVRDVQ